MYRDSIRQMEESTQKEHVGLQKSRTVQSASHTSIESEGGSPQTSLDTGIATKDFSGHESRTQPTIQIELVTEDATELIKRLHISAESTSLTVNTVIKEELILPHETYHEDITDEHLDLDRSIIKEENIDRESHLEERFALKQCVSDSLQTLPLTDLVREDVKYMPYTCLTCNKRFKKLCGLVRHKQTHEFSHISNKKEYKCNVCNKVFNKSPHFSQHKLIHLGVKRYRCDVCNTAFTNAGTLVNHKLIHSSIKKYQCDMCNKRFTHAHNLSKHKLMHSGIKKYHCNLCNKSFTESGFYRHKLVHSGVKKYQCDMCSKGYDRKSCLLQHNKKMHRDVTIRQNIK